MAAALKKEFANYAEAKQAMIDTLDALLDENETIMKLIKETAEEPQQKKIATLMPVVQKTLGVPITKHGFPAGPMGFMIAFAALQKWQRVDEAQKACWTAQTPDAGTATPIADVLGWLKDVMMSAKLSETYEAEVDAFKTKLA